MKKLLNKIKTITKGINRLQVLVMGLMMNLLVAVPAYAVPNPGVDLASWFKTQILPIAGVIMIGAIVKYISKKNVVAIVVTVVLGGIVMVFITDPEFAKTIAEWLLNITGLK